MQRSRLVFSTFLVVALAGCGSGSQMAAPVDASAGGESDGGESDAAFLTCDTDKRATPYHPGMQVVSSVGTFTVTLIASVPGPPVKGPNTWTIQVDESDTGVPLDGLEIAVTPWMPDHGHGTTPVNVQAAGAAGHYTLEPLYLYMSAFWQIKLNIVSTAADAGISDGAIIPICIP